MYSGFDPQDAVRLPWAAIRDGHIDVQRGKTGEAVSIRLTAQMLSILSEARGHSAATVATNHLGKSWSVSGCSRPGTR